MRTMTRPSGLPSRQHDEVAKRKPSPDLGEIFSINCAYPGSSQTMPRYPIPFFARYSIARTTETQGVWTQGLWARMNHTGQKPPAPRGNAWHLCKGLADCRQNRILPAGNSGRLFNKWESILDFDNSPQKILPGIAKPSSARAPMRPPKPWVIRPFSALDPRFSQNIKTL